MGGKSPVAASEDQRAALTALAGSRERGEADRARAVLLTLSGWTSARIAEAFGVREDTVRLWRSDFGKGGVAPLPDQPVADRRNWTIARLRAEVEAREGVSISRSQLSKALRKKTSAGGGPDTR